MTRFNAESTRLNILSDDLIITAFQSGLIVGPLYTELCRFPPRTAQDMWKVVRTFAVADDATRRKTKADAYRKKPLEKQASSSLANHEYRAPRHRDRDRSSLRTLSLTRSRSEILSSHRDLFRNPPPLQAPPHKRDRGKWCDYHKDHGHITEECRDLKVAIEEAHRRGQLQQYTSEGTPRGEGKPREDVRREKRERNYRSRDYNRRGRQSPPPRRDFPFSRTQAYVQCD